MELKKDRYAIMKTIPLFSTYFRKTKQKLELNFLSGCKNYWQVFKTLRVNKSYASTDGFI